MRTSAFRLFMIVFTITINTCLFGKADELEGEPIPLEYNEPGDDGKPIIRGPVIIPFSALYCEAAACVNVSFLWR